MFSILQGLGQSTSKMLTQGYSTGLESPAYPVVELIAQNILTTVQGVSGVINGEPYALKAQRHTKAGDKRDHLNAVISQVDPKEAPEPKVYNTKEWYQPFEIGVYVIPLETDTTPVDTYLNQIRADVENALLIDRFRGGNALDTEIREPQYYVDKGLEYYLIVVKAEVNYRTSEVNAYINAR